MHRSGPPGPDVPYLLRSAGKKHIVFPGLPPLWSVAMGCLPTYEFRRRRRGLGRRAKAHFRGQIGRKAKRLPVVLWG
jgi:hypothetical protein